MNDTVVGIVTVTINGIRYRGGYRMVGDEFVVTAYGIKAARMDASLLEDGSPKVAVKLAKLMLTDMVNQVSDRSDLDLTLSTQGATSTVAY